MELIHRQSKQSVSNTLKKQLLRVVAHLRAALQSRHRHEVQTRVSISKQT